MTDGKDYNTRLAELQGELYALLLPKIRQRREQPTDDVLGMLVRARDDHGHALSDEQLIAHTNILLVAGHETSTSLSAWLLYLLSQHPDYAQRVLDEQDALLARDAEPTLEAVKRMKLLEHALSEAERLYPPVSNGPRGVLEDFEFGGYRVPAGTHVFYSIAGAHMHPDNLRRRRIASTPIASRRRARSTRRPTRWLALAAGRASVSGSTSPRSRSRR